MFFSSRGPMSRNGTAILLATASCTERATQMPPGAASDSSRDAMLTASPRRSPSRSTTSPMVTPMRYIMRRLGGYARLRVRSDSWMSMADRTASTALSKAHITESPAVLKTRPP
jgi:hypothetical protein